MSLFVYSTLYLAFILIIAFSALLYFIRVDTDAPPHGEEGDPAWYLMLLAALVGWVLYDICAALLGVNVEQVQWLRRLLKIITALEFFVCALMFWRPLLYVTIIVFALVLVAFVSAYIFWGHPDLDGIIVYVIKKSLFP